jgi:hypothetical protein
MFLRIKREFAESGNFKEWGPGHQFKNDGVWQPEQGTPEDQAQRIARQR